MKKMNDKITKQKLKHEESKRQLEEYAEVRPLLDKMRRKSFDYQERWHGFGSPVGLGIGFALLGIGAFFFALAITTLQ
ncbi:hypothetical protein [Rhodoluna sp.]|jgi:hypothetical protein|uniref:hypothetical protein n=1 Tax=Rhodoluna sp. TaxID=1969481 RepID=UPI0025D77A34|nr:hypothetical protein [Rhodoluna sp.]